MRYPEKVWLGPNYLSNRVFVLGQSWFGHYEGDLATDDGYIREYLAGNIHDAAYDRWARSSGMSLNDFWNGIMFTNFVQWTGPTRDPGPGAKDFKNAVPRLVALLNLHQPLAVWIIGKTQSKYSKPIVEVAQIACEVIAIRASDYAFAESWGTLTAKSKGNQRGDA